MKRIIRLPLFAAASMLAVSAANATPPGFNEGGMGSVPMNAGGETPRSVQHWWPEVVDLQRLRQNEQSQDPLGEDFDYTATFASLDLDEVKADIATAMTDSKEWWPGG